MAEADEGGMLLEKMTIRSMLRWLLYGIMGSSTSTVSLHSDLYLIAHYRSRQPFELVTHTVLSGLSKPDILTPDDPNICSEPRPS